MRSVIVLVWALMLIAVAGVGEDAGADMVTCVAGRVTDKAGEPISGAMVTWGVVEPSLGEAVRAETDADGRYFLPLPAYGPGYRLAVFAEGYAPCWVDYDFYPEPGRTVKQPPSGRDFTLEPAHRLEGVVVDEMGEPVAGATVAVRTPKERVQDVSSWGPPSPTPIPGVFGATTGPSGAFALDGLPASDVHLEVKAPHRYVSSRNYPVDVPCRIVMQGSGRPGMVRARVVDAATGEPIPMFKVAQRYVADQAQCTDGLLDWGDGLTESGAYAFHVYARGYLPWEGKLTAASLGGVVREAIALTAGPSFLGRLVDCTSGAPLPSVEVLSGVIGEAWYFEWADYDGYIDGHHGLTTVQRAVTDERGVFWVCERPDAPAGFFVDIPGYARTIFRADERPQPGPDGIVTLAVQPEAVVTGLRPMDAWPDAIAFGVQLVEEGRMVPELWLPTVAVRPMEPFSLDRLAPGRYMLYATVPLSPVVIEGRTIRELEIGSGQTLDVGVVVIPEE